MTYKHLHVLSQCGVSSPLYAAQKNSERTNRTWLAYSHFFAGPDSTAGFNSARSYNGRLTAESWMLLDGRLLRLRKAVWLFLPFRLEPDLIT